MDKKQGYILVVDDNAKNRQVLTEHLRVLGYQVKSTADGQAALQMAKATPPELILLEIGLPGMNGYEVCQQLKDDPALKTIPVIFVSAYTEIDNVSKAFAVGGVDYITKPFHLEELKARVSTHISLHHYLQQEHASRIEEEAKFKSLFENSPDAILLIDHTGAIEMANQKTRTLFGHDPEDLIGKPIETLVPKEAAPHHVGLRNAYLTNPKVRTLDSVESLRAKRKDGSTFHADIGLNPTFIDNNLYITATVRDISDQVEANKKIHSLAYYDPLTKLPNRNFFFEHLQNLDQDDHCCGIILIDIDDFKNINDTLGHLAGDQLIAMIAERIASQIRPKDIFARFGGDEFIILLTNNTSTESINALAKNIIHDIYTPVRIGKSQIYPSVSIGIALSSKGMTANELISKSEAAMFEAKRNGKNQLAFYTDDMNVKLSQQFEIENLLHDALNKGELFLVFQPQFDHNKQRIIGMEALLRWNSSKLGFMSPGLFIPVAENSKLIHNLGDWVLKEACLKSHALVAHNPELIIAINISTKQLAKEDFVARVEKILHETQAPVANIELEITESALMGDIQKTIDKLRALKALGLQIAIDDFGTGYSSMNYLKELPVDTIKIDKSFVDNIPGNRKDNGIVTTIISLAKHLDLHLIAEGVETQEQLDFLVKNGSEAYQGYLFAKPMKTEEVLAFLQSRT